MMHYTPVLFTPKVVRALVHPRKPGAYVLGQCSTFDVGYVGRSDTCVQGRLARHNHLYRYEYFIYRYARSAEEAYQFECEAYHALQQRGVSIANRYHPAAPRGSGLRCPYCDFAEGLKEQLLT